MIWLKAHYLWQRLISTLIPINLGKKNLPYWPIPSIFNPHGSPKAGASRLKKEITGFSHPV
jgi:hypothetical protein